MTRFVPAVLIALLCFGYAPLLGQTATPRPLTQETKLHERPDTQSKVRLTLPEGMKVTVLTRQEEWLAVSVSEEISGWILASALGAETGSTTDVLREMRDRPRTSAGGTPPPATGASSSPPPPPRAAAGASPPPPPPPSGGVRSAATSGPPPPPPPPTSRSTGADDAIESTGDQSVGGLYDAHSWSRFHYDAQDDFQAVGAQYGVMINRIGEFEANLTASRSPSSIDDVYGLDLVLRANFYFLQPSDELPVGIYGAALGAFQHIFPPSQDETIALFSPVAGFSQTIALVAAASSSSSSCACGHENVARAGGEGGFFARLPLGSGANRVVIPRVAVRHQKYFIVGEDTGESFGLTTVLAGAEFLFGRFGPGFFVEHTEEVNLISISLALPFGDE